MRVIDEVIGRGSTLADSTIRTCVVSRMCRETPHHQFCVVELLGRRVTGGKVAHVSFVATRSAT